MCSDYISSIETWVNEFQLLAVCADRVVLLSIVWSGRLDGKLCAGFGKLNYLRVRLDNNISPSRWPSLAILLV